MSLPLHVRLMRRHISSLFSGRVGFRARTAFRARFVVVAAMVATCFLNASATTCAEETRSPSESESFFFTSPGSSREGLVRTVSGQDSATLQITVCDSDSGLPTPCRINVIGQDGNFYQPAENPLSMYSLTGQWPNAGAKGNRKEKGPWRYLGRFFYSTGTINVSVPPGVTRIEVFKGFEYQPQSTQVTATAGQTQPVTIDIQRTTRMDREHYFGGDPHLHLARVTDRDDQTLFELLAAEDIAFGTPLGYNEPAGPYAGFMDRMDYPQFRGLGLGSVRTQQGVSILSGQEYRSSQYGHLNLFLRDRLVLEGRSHNADDWPVYGIVGAETQSQGGYAIHAHGGYAQEIYADAALGTVNAVELLQFGVYRGIGLTDWYHMLNTGYRFPCVGASDYPACRFLGDCRTYVWNSAADETASGGGAGGTKDLGTSRPEFPAWLKYAAEGRSFVTTGPLLLLDVNGKRPGETIQEQSASPVNVAATVRLRCEVTTVNQIDLIVNGVVLKTFPVTAAADTAEVEATSSGKWLTFRHEMPVSASSWIAARAWSVTPGGQPDAESHTNPVYVYLGNKKPYVQASLDTWVSRVDGQLEKHAKRTFDQKARVLDYFQQARDRLLSIRERGGLTTDENPSAFDDRFTSADSENFEMDPSRPDVTDAQLKEFLKPLPSRSPEDAVRTFEGVDGFRMQLVAAEPMVHSPVAAAFDEDGNMFVCEMTDYPYKPTEGADPIGTLRFLRDTNGDGVYDEAHVFADKLLWAAGVVPWKGGVFVAATPDILYLKDTDGDHKADVRRKVFTGFGTGNQQAMVNNLQLGMDHWIYGTTAGNGGTIRPGNQPDAPGILVSGRDFRFDPFTEAFELVTGTVQFGNAFDDWGNRFTCSQSQPLVQIVLPDHYLARNPFLPSPPGIQDIAPGPVPIFRISPIERWRQIRSSRRILRNERSANSSGASHHVIDAAAGVTIYRGGAYPAEYAGQAFVGDGQNNLIHRRKLTLDGVVFKSERVDQNTDFIRTPDIWFRPVNLINAPDGTLYCCDMNREVLESIHIPLDVVKHLDLKSGRRNGRIYRIAPPGFQPPAPPRLSSATSAELLAALESPHGWWRDTAHRLLYERQDLSVVPELRRLAVSSPLPQCRLLAAWQLRGLKSLDDSTCLTLLQDTHSGVRENAVRLAESRLQDSTVLLDAVCRLAEDEVPRVRFQTAFTLGYSADPRSVQALAKIALRDGTDPWIRTAVLSSASASAEQLFAALVNEPQTSQASEAVIGQLAALIGARSQPAETARILNHLAESSRSSDPAAVDALLRELGSGLRRSAGQFPNDSASSGGRLIEAALQRAAATAQDGSVAEDSRVSAVAMLSCRQSSSHRKIMEGLLHIDQPGTLQIAAAKALADDTDPEAAEILLKHWTTCLPATRMAAMNGLLSQESGTLQLLQAAARQDLSVAEIEPTRRELLLKHGNTQIRELAAALFGTTAERPRQAIVAEYRAALDLKGDVAAGQKVFEKTCAACHQLNGIGNSIGPNLASSPSRDPSALLNNILDPNQFVLPNYLQYVVVDKSGRTFTGLLSAQSATSITLRKEKAETITILRGDIEELVSSNKSLMPEGLEKELSLQSVADLISWITTVSAKTPDNPNAERDFGTLPGLIETDGSR